MELNEYQDTAITTATFDDTKALEYLALGLAGEAGEVANKLKKVVRGDEKYQDIKYLQEVVRSELGDVMWYIAVMCDRLDISLESVAQDNIKKITRRFNEGTTKGDGDNR